MVEMTVERLRGGELLGRLRERADSGSPVVELAFRSYGRGRSLPARPRGWFPHADRPIATGAGGAA